MGDCFPKNGGGFPLPEHCQEVTGNSEYAVNYKQWCSPQESKSFAPDSLRNLQKSAYNKGPGLRLPQVCDCSQPPELFRFETTYTRDFTECVHNDPRTRRHPVVDGIRPKYENYREVFNQNNSCCNTSQCCSNEECQQLPQGIELRYSHRKPKPCQPRLRKECLIKPGTDTSNCCRCPKPIPCCPCPNDSNLCGACCGCEYPCKLHQATTTPTRKYPIAWGTPRYVEDPRIPPRRPKLLCAGGTLECPVQNQFPTKQAIKQAKYRLMEALEKERCRYPPECIESIYRASYKTPPLNDAPKYCSKEQMEEARRAEEEVAAKGLPPKGLPMYCLDGGKPPDPRPAFDHFSTYEADYVWEKAERFKLLGGEIPCTFQIKPLCSPIINACEVIKQRTEEKERWGEDWECCPPPAE